MRSEPVIADLPLESRVDCSSVLPLARLEVAPGAESDLAWRQSAFGFHHERAKRFGYKTKSLVLYQFFNNFESLTNPRRTSARYVRNQRTIRQSPENAAMRDP